MQKGKLYLREAVPSDMDMLYGLVNDEAVRKNAFHKSPIPYDEHKDWFGKMMEDESQLQYILMLGDRAVGQVRLSVDGDVAEIHYSILPEMRGMGYGKTILHLVKELVHEEYPFIRTLVGKVKPSNVASAYCFEENGFQETYEQYEFDMGRYEAEPEILNSGAGEGGGIVLYLTNNKNTLPLFRWIAEHCDARVVSDRLSIGMLEMLRPKLVVSYNYMYLIPADCIDHMEGNMINLHISLLPWNRGSSPNIWSFIDGTPKGITIHQISAGLDEGDIVCQKEIGFDPSEETFASTYDRLNEEIVALFKDHWDELYSDAYKSHAIRQQGAGTYHTMRDLKELRQQLPFCWEDNIAEFLERYHRIIGDYRNG